MWLLRDCHPSPGGIGQAFNRCIAVPPLPERILIPFDKRLWGRITAAQAPSRPEEPGPCPQDDYARGAERLGLPTTPKDFAALAGGRGTEAGARGGKRARRAPTSPAPGTGTRSHGLSP